MRVEIYMGGQHIHTMTNVVKLELNHEPGCHLVIDADGNEFHAWLSSLRLFRPDGSFGEIPAGVPDTNDMVAIPVPPGYFTNATLTVPTGEFVAWPACLGPGIAFALAMFIVVVSLTILAAKRRARP